MYLLVSLLASLSIVSALPTTADVSSLETKMSYPWNKTKVANLVVNCGRPEDELPHKCDMSFDFYDPNSELVQQSNGASCNVSWAWGDGNSTEREPDSTFGTGFTLCEPSRADNFFQVQVNEFVSASEFTFTVSHSYKDDLHFNFPLNFPNSFTKIEIPDAHPHVDPMPGLDRFSYESTGVIEVYVNGLS